jgi:magnesium transporter
MAKPDIALQLPPAPAAMQHCLVHGGVTWLDFSFAGQEQVAFLREHYRFHPLHLEDITSHTQRPKLDDGPDERYVFLVLHFPVLDDTMRLAGMSEVDIFIGPDFLVTVHDGKLRPLRRLVSIAAGSGRSHLMARGVGFLLYRIIQTLLDACVPMLYQLDQQLDRIESAIFSTPVVATVQELSFLRRDVISLRRILRPNLPPLRLLAARERPFLQFDQEAYYGDLVDGLTRQWDMLEEHKEIIEGLDATLGSLTSHRINQEMKTFTVITVTMLPLTLVASILGMNVLIPFAEHPLALPVILLLMVLMALAMVALFRYKRWL